MLIKFGGRLIHSALTFVLFCCGQPIVCQTCYLAMANRPRWQLCWSPANLLSFEVYFEHIASPEEQDELVHLPHVLHRPVPDPPPVSVLNYRGQPTRMPWIHCRENNCKRCMSGRGGYQFRWVDTRWSSESVLDTTVGAATHWERNDLPWPAGIRKRGF